MQRFLRFFHSVWQCVFSILEGMGGRRGFLPLCLMKGMGGPPPPVLNGGDGWEEGIPPPVLNEGDGGTPSPCA